MPASRPEDTRGTQQQGSFASAPRMDIVPTNARVDAPYRTRAVRRRQPEYSRSARIRPSSTCRDRNGGHADGYRIRRMAYRISRESVSERATGCYGMEIVRSEASRRTPAPFGANKPKPTKTRPPGSRAI